MNLREAILKEHSKRQAHNIANYLIDNQSLMPQFMELYFGHEFVISQRAAYAFYVIGQKRIDLLEPYLEQLVQNLKKPKLHDAIKRSTLGVLARLDIPEILHI
jgi:hypothetical protein